MPAVNADVNRLTQNIEDRRSRRRIDHHAAALPPNRNQDVGQLFAVEVGDALAAVRRGLQAVRDALLALERERDARLRQGGPRELLGDVAHLRLVRAQELPARGYGIEQVAYFDGSARRGGAGARVADFAALGANLLPHVVVAPPGDDPQPRDGADAGEGFAAEAHRLDVEQVLVGADLAGRVLGDAQDQVGRVHAAAVVRDLDQPAPAVQNADVNSPGPGVERVLDQLLDHAGGPLDALAGGDAADEGG